MFTAIAIHHANPDYAEDFVAFMHRVIETVGHPPGLVDFDGYRDAETSRLVGLSRWESQEAFEAALQSIGSLGHERRDEWSLAPDDLLMLTSI
jgi:quinol monooxygenase YgiN